MNDVADVALRALSLIGIVGGTLRLNLLQTNLLVCLAVRDPRLRLYRRRYTFIVRLWKKRISRNCENLLFYYFDSRGCSTFVVRHLGHHSSLSPFNRYYPISLTTFYSYLKNISISVSVSFDSFRMILFSVFLQSVFLLRIISQRL